VRKIADAMSLKNKEEARVKIRSESPCLSSPSEYNPYRKKEK